MKAPGPAAAPVPPPAAAVTLDRRLLPTRGVVTLLGEALLDLLLLLPRALGVVLFARRRQREMAALILGRSDGPHAA